MFREYFPSKQIKQQGEKYNPGRPVCVRQGFGPRIAQISSPARQSLAGDDIWSMLGPKPCLTPAGRPGLYMSQLLLSVAKLLLDLDYRRSLASVQHEGKSFQFTMPGKFSRSTHHDVSQPSRLLYQVLLSGSDVV